jgi:DNA-binding transcriptional MerR regulator
MALVSIGQAARRLGINASALRYYDERGLVHPTVRRSGRRMYDAEQLRRLAFIQLMHTLGVRLDAAAAVLDESSDQWREAVREQIAAVDALIARALGARDLLQHALECPADHPVRECPRMIEVLDRRLAGVTLEQLATEYGHDPVQPHSRRQGPGEVRFGA